MLKAYVGIASQLGLELFCPEHPQTVRFLLRRVQLEQGRVAGFWSVVPDEIAEHILVALQCGRSRYALCLMQQHAREGGSLVPNHEEPTPVAANRDLG